VADLSVPQLVEWSPGTFAVRLRAELLGNASRMVHLVPIPETTVIPESLTACCGKVILPGQAELVRVFEGMPCTLCLVFAPTPHLPAHS
jgi:hypothetical protein